ncbi:MAG: hypothetical protein ACRDLM_06300 [Gaiellaceae bacterium]
MSAVASTRGAAGRLLAPLRGRGDSYAVCPEDGFWFRPLYTSGKCPLCGEKVSSGAPRLPLLLRADRFFLAMGALALVSLVMCGLVLYLFFR